MRKAFASCAVMLLVASSAFAGGIDLSVGACPGNVGAIGGEGGSVDCAGNAIVTVLATWAPNEDLPDLVGLDGLVEVQAQPNLDASAFWNVDPAGCGAPGLNSNQARPGGAVCNSPVPFLAAWSPAGSGTAIAALRRGPSIERLAFTVFRPSTVAVTAGQKIFGVQLLFNANGDLASEGGGPCAGCASPVAMVWNSGKPGTGGSTASELTQGTGTVAGVSACVGFNTGSANCSAVPVKKHTWGQLKSLYR